MTSPATQTEERLAEVRFLTVAEVASLMRVSKMTVYRMVHAGELGAVQVGRRLFRIPEPTLIEYLSTSIAETRAILADPDTMAAIAEAEAE